MSERKFSSDQWRSAICVVITDKDEIVMRGRSKFKLRSIDLRLHMHTLLQSLYWDVNVIKKACDRRTEIIL